MASKFGMAGGIPERRVRPIWDAIDSRQFKNALKLSVALLSKYPNYPYGLSQLSLVWMCWQLDFDPQSSPWLVTSWVHNIVASRWGC
ncbi:hypothetical protein RJ639_007509 [Escallonia herrerae]|uniref:Uncharacterized protein n=1 Tax=Escallonia herrerae TaxID=1293975 RepID=A0AA88VV70_9ASTE|nr:hypothetical protein RJ639_007509 [Escallonia herrerae]